MLKRNVFALLLLTNGILISDAHAISPINEAILRCCFLSGGTRGLADFSCVFHNSAERMDSLNACIEETLGFL